MTWSTFFNFSAPTLKLIALGSLIPHLLVQFDYEVCLSAITFGVLSILQWPNLMGRNITSEIQSQNLSALVAGSWLARSVFLKRNMQFVLWPLGLDLLMMIVNNRYLLLSCIKRNRLQEILPSKVMFSPGTVQSLTVEWLITSVCQSLKSNSRIWSQRASLHVGEVLARSGFEVQKLSIESIEVMHEDSDVAFIRFEGTTKIEIGIDCNLRVKGTFVAFQVSSLVVLLLRGFPLYFRSLLDSAFPSFTAHLNLWRRICGGSVPCPFIVRPLSHAQLPLVPRRNGHREASAQTGLAVRVGAL